MNELIKKINNFYTVVESWLSSIWDMFFSTTPANVPVKKMKSDGTIETVEVPNHARIKQNFKTWKEQMEIQLNLGEKVNSGVKGVTFYGVGSREIAFSNHPAGYIISEPIEVSATKNRIKIELLSDTRKLNGYVELEKPYDELYVYFTLTGADAFFPPVIPGQQSQEVVSSYVSAKECEDGVRLVWVVADGGVDDDISVDAIPEINNFYGQMRFVNSSNQINIGEPA